ncbi:hypothetical protein ATK36_0652 [Amycolatopsis sulphurea]|uniref:Integral membrane protein n=1 Tax=Amycolatopsis sulphurea TaxID=76022 RepID=A0A2A9G092_9PSEU|nr:hypothetical protein [Amycolatopsis sulphurea]PFG57094.1 hypothetical protein ATK36_0652 [Amycolatopsis sulphurea]
MSTTEAVRTPAPPRWPRLVFRATTLVSAVLLFDQAVFAGQFLSGGYDSLQTHRENATYAGISVLVSAVAAVLVRRPGRGPWWPILGSLGLFGLIALQIALGFARLITVHVPVGVATILLAATMAVAAWRR